MRLVMEKTDVVDELRDLLNMLAVYDEEYNLPEEVVDDLRHRIGRVANALQDLEPELEEQ